MLLNLLFLLPSLLVSFSLPKLFLLPNKQFVVRVLLSYFDYRTSFKLFVLPKLFLLPHLAYIIAYSHSPKQTQGKPLCNCTVSSPCGWYPLFFLRTLHIFVYSKKCQATVQLHSGLFPLGFYKCSICCISNSSPSLHFQVRNVPK